MDNKKHIVNLECFREMLHICPRLPHQPFIEPPFEEEILAFLYFLHSAVIRKLTDGLYHKRNVDFAYLMWEDFVHQVEHKDTKKSNEMYYPRFTKVIIHHFMSKDPSIPRRNKFSALLPIELTKEDIRNYNAYKVYYAVAIGVTQPKPKASVQKTRSTSDTTITPLTTAAGPRLTTSKKGKQAAKASKAKNEGTSSIPGVPDVPTDESEEELSWNSTDKEGDDNEGKDGDGDDGEEGDDDGEEGNDDDDQEDKGDDGEDDEEDESGDDEKASDEEEFIHPSLSTHTEEEIRDEEIAPLPMSTPTITSSTIATITTTQQAPLPPTTAPSTLQVAVQLQSDKLCEEAQKENDEFLKTIDENMQKIIKGQVKEQVKVQVSKILPRIEQTINEQLEAEVLTRSSNSSKTSYVVVADLSEMELKKILTEKMEGNKSIHQSNEQRNLYKALVEAYESNKIILDTYGDIVTLKRRRDGDADKDEEPFAGSDRGSKRHREGKEPESASALQETATRSADRSTQGSQSRQTSASESATVKEPIQTTFEMEEPSHPEFKTGTDDQPIVELSQHPEWFSQQQKPPTPDRDWNKTLPATYGIIQPDDDKLYKFKEGDFKRLGIQDIEDMLLLLVKGKLTNLTVEERFALNVSLRMFTRSIVIQRRVEDLQLGVESY
nr:hypothetical protein [Tanacetum cinerariifolium]